MQTQTYKDDRVYWQYQSHFRVAACSAGDNVYGISSGYNTVIITENESLQNLFARRFVVSFSYLSSGAITIPRYIDLCSTNQRVVRAAIAAAIVHPGSGPCNSHNRNRRRPYLLWHRRSCPRGAQRFAIRESACPN